MIAVLRKSTPLTPNNSLLKDAGNYFLRRLLNPDEHRDLKVTISVTSLTGTMRGDATISSLSCGQVRINANDDFLTQLSTLAHEMVHIKQYVTGQLDCSESGKRWKWHGRYHKGTEPYELSPWEREAYATEGILAQAFIQEELLKDTLDRQQEHAKLR